ncbi:MAG: glycosyltransferase family 4 protein [Clostridia bacterium]|nr:glycosyltransferase family 4 protein [Clostridia bacterium]
MILANSDIGLYRFRKEVLEEFVKSDEVFFCVPDGGFIKEIESLGCRFVPCNSLDRRGTNPIKDLKLLMTYLNLIKQIRPDVVLTYTIKCNVYGGLACRLKRIPYLANVTGLGTTIENGGLLKKLSLTLYRIGLKRARCVFFQNGQNMKLFTDNKIVRGKVKLIPGSGVNVETHRYEAYPPDRSCFRYLFVGRVMKDKGIEELLAAVGKLADEGKKVFLDVVGGSDEDYTGMLAEFEKRNIVKYHGPQSNVHAFYTQTHCVVLPSYHEGMANVMLEAASTGRPVITSRIPGCQETFEEGKTGYGCEPRDAVSLKDAMEKMYRTPWEERRAMGIAGREKVAKEFNRQIIIDAYQEQIDLICK